MKQDKYSCARWLAVGALLLCWLPACQQAPLIVEAGLITPTALAAVRGGTASNPHAMLAAINGSQGTLQLVNLPEDGQLEQIDVVAAAPLGFPLQIPVGPNPVGLAALADGAWLLIVDGLRRDVTIVDVVQKKPLEQPALVLPFSAIQQVVALPFCSNPDANCLGQAMVVGGPGEGVALLRLQQEALTAAPKLVLAGQWLLGQSVLAVSPFGQGPGLVALVEQGWQVQLWDLSATPKLLPAATIGLPVAMDTVIGLPQSSQLALLSKQEKAIFLYAYDGAQLSDTGTFVPQPLQQDTMALPSCLATCDDTFACNAAPWLEQQYCLTSAGLQQRPGWPNNSLLLRATAISLAPVVFPNTGLRDGCAPASRYRTGMLVLFADGRMQLVGIDGQLETDGSPAPARLLSQERCRQASLRLEQPSVSSGLDSCPKSNLAADVFPCLQDQAGGQIAWLRGSAASTALQVQFAGSVPGAQVREGGTIDEAGRFSDVLRDLSSLSLMDESAKLANNEPYGGDILEITSPPLGGQRCLLAAGQPESCSTRYRIVAKEVDGQGRTWLRCDRPIPASCYPSNGLIAYNVYTNDVLAVAIAQDGAQLGFERIPLGAKIGLGTPFFAKWPGSLRFKPGKLDTTEPTYCADAPGASWLAFHLQPDGYAWQSSQAETWLLQDPIRSVVLEPGKVVDQAGSALPANLFMQPYDLIQARALGSSLPVAVSYPNGNALGIWYLADELEKLNDPSTYRLLR